MYLSYWDATNQQYENIWEVNLNASGVQANETYIVCNKSQKYAVWYPCITIDSLKVKKSGDESGLTITLNDQILTEFEDFSMIPYIHTSIDDNDDIVTDNKEYVIIKSDTLLKYGIKNIAGVSERARFNLTFNINYTISNADTAIYLDALQVLKENSIPKVSYNVDLSVVNTDLLDTAYNLLGTIANINDTTLKFENVQGYVSEVDLKLDMPWEDSVVLKNYKNKFEDLFSKIVAETSAMQKNAYTVGFAAAALTTSGELKEETLQATINNADLNYAFNNGTLTIDEVNGITGISDDGIVAMRGGGIFTANQKNENGDWIWNTGILPSGINADLITSGRIDTNQIRLFGGQDLRFIWNEHGIMAYKPLYGDEVNGMAPLLGIDEKQYVVHNGDGIYLVAKTGAEYNYNEEVSQYQGHQYGEGDGGAWPESGDFWYGEGTAKILYNELSTHFSTDKNIQYTFLYPNNYSEASNLSYILKDQSEDEMLININFTYTEEGQSYNSMIIMSLPWYIVEQPLRLDEHKIAYGIMCYDIEYWISEESNQTYFYAKFTICEEYGKRTYYQKNTLNRIELGWDGLVLRNWYGHRMFWASPDTGSLVLEGAVWATGGLYIQDSNSIEAVEIKQKKML